MASFSDDADWGSEVGSDFVKFPDDGADWLGDGSGTLYRIANIYDITSLPTGDTVSEVKEDLYVSTISSSGSETWDCDGYNGDGQGDPETDTGADMYAGCGNSGAYASGDTSFQTTGQKSITFSSTANSDIEAARDAGTTFAVAWQIVGSPGSNVRSELREYTHVSTPPKLTVTHSAGGGGLPTGTLSLLGAGI